MRIFRFCLCTSLFSLAIHSAHAGQTHFQQNGYITKLDPPSSFQFNRDKVVTTPSTKMVTYDGAGTPNDQPFQMRLFPMGANVTVSGTLDPQTHVITAKKVILLPSGSLTKLSGTAGETQAPSVVKDASGWQGTVYTDGYVLTITPKTAVTLPQSVDLSRFQPEVRVKYQAERQADGSILARQISFTPDDEIEEERKARDSSVFKIDLPDYDKKIPGKVHFFLQSMDILPDRELQESVDMLGQKLVPLWQKNLADNDPRKIHFRFFVIQSTKGFTNTVSKDSGTVLIPAQVIAKLQNEAQLATLLAADIASVIEMDFYRSRTHRHTQEAINVALIPAPFGLDLIGQMTTSGSFTSGYWTPLVEHAYRLGLRYVIAAGYDPRQAPIAIQRLSERHPDTAKEKPFTSLAAYVDAELGFDFSGTDFSQLKTGEAEYEKLLAQARASDPNLSKKG